MKEQFHNLITNTTSLVGYIAVLMFVGAYLGGDKSYAFDPAVLKGSIMESRSSIDGTIVSTISAKPITIIIDGRKYEAVINHEIDTAPVFTY
jgi:hypothetical protein